MSFFPYCTLAEITHEIRSKNVSPVEIVDSHLKRIEALQPKLNAFVHPDPEGAREQARGGKFGGARRATRASPWRAAHHQELHRCRRLALSCWFPSPQRLRPTTERPACFAMGGRGRHPSRKHQHSRILDGLRNRQPAHRKNKNPWNLARLHGLDRALDLWWFFFGPVIGNLFRQSVAGREGQISPMFREYLAYATSGDSITLDQFTKACADRDLLRADILRQMRDASILLSPVSNSPAFRHGQGNYLPGAGYRDTMRFSQWLNLTGFPGACVPVGVSSEGLPIGVQVIGRPFEHELVLAVAEAIEKARGPWQPPPIVVAETAVPASTTTLPEAVSCIGLPHTALRRCSSALSSRSRKML